MTIVRDIYGHFVKGNKSTRKYGHLSLETRQKQSESLKAYFRLHPRILTEEHKRNLWKNRSHTHSKLSEETKEKIRKARMRQVLPVKDTSIEVKVQNWLTRAGIGYEKHKMFQAGGKLHRVDLFLPDLNLAIECDGEYWHSRSFQKEFDKYFMRKLAEECHVGMIRLQEDTIRATSNFYPFLEFYRSLLS